MRVLRRLLDAVRRDSLRRAVGFRWRQLVYANSHAGDHYLKFGDAARPFTLRRSLGLMRRLTSRPVAFSIDVTSVCNLECPTCPVANWPKASWTGAKGIMDAALLHRLIGKAARECIVGEVCLFAYTEPLLHPQLPELIAVVKSYGLTCVISTNLNVMRDADALLRARPDVLQVSLSGFYQESYGVTHAGGDIEVVKENLRTLADAKRRLASTAEVKVSFHKYRTNLDELPLMKAFALSLGLGFEESWAGFFPLEKVLTHAKPELALAEITDADLRVIDRLAVPLPSRADLDAQAPASSCRLHDEAVVIDVEGNVYLCCEAAMDATRNKIASYLDIPLEEIQGRKKRHSLCTTCMAAGLPLSGEGEYAP